MSGGFYLDAAGTPVFAWYHPADEPRGTAVLLCPPFGWDELASYRSRREWAEALADAGYATLRFDFPGAGDSGGAPRDPGRVSAWLATVTTAARWLREASGCRRTAAIGLGLGGLVAVAAAADGAPLDDLVLWNVPARGKALVRELRAFSRLEDAPVPADHDDGLPDGALSVAGFVLGAETVTDLQALDLTALALSRGRVLLLERDGIPPDSDLRAAFGTAGADVRVASGDGWEAMTVRPDESHPPLAVFERVRAWLDDAQPARGASGRPDRASRAEVAPGVFEWPLSVPTAGDGLFAIRTEPTERDETVAVAFLNAGAIRRVGPSRLWVELARSLAADGVASIRLDFPGIGDSAGDAWKYADVAALYEQEFAGHVREALDALDGTRFVVVGLCSGGYWGVEAALRDDRISAAVALNPGALVWDRNHVVARDAGRLGRRAFDPSAWARFLRGEQSMSVRRMRTAAGWALLAPARSIRGRGAGAAPVSDRLTGRLDSLRARGQRVHLLLAENEPVRDELTDDGVLDRLDAWGNVTVALLPGESHTLRPLWMQSLARGFVEKAIAAER